jgi:hypothetical protein
VRFVHGDYFGAAGITVVHGRAFSRDDDGGPSVAIVNERFAALHWPGGDAVGRRIAFRDFGDASGPYWMTIVGVAADIKGRTLVTRSSVRLRALPATADRVEPVGDRSRAGEG